jgi:RNA polymerase sigma-70 factor (ECF subfamily)
MSSQALNSAAALTLADTPATPFDDIDSVIALHQQRIFRFLLLSTRDPDAAQSLTQDTFLRAWSARASFRNECSIATWLTSIALNLLRDHTRTERFRFWKRAAANSLDVSDPSISIPHHASSVESRLIASEQLALVWDSVAQLSSRQRSVFVLRFVEEMDLNEISAATNLPVSTVKSHLYRALAVIRTRHSPAQQETA